MQQIQYTAEQVETWKKHITLILFYGHFLLFIINKKTHKNKYYFISHITHEG